ncbi:MAG: hypothetical protein QXO75_07815 [Nitrososphaerota archaeon]
MSTVKEIKIKVYRVLDAATPFKQGGSWRLPLPPRVVEYYLQKGGQQERPLHQVKYLVNSPLLFIETDKGLLLRTLKENYKDPDTKDLTFAPISGLSSEEISKLISEIAEEEK